MWEASRELLLGSCHRFCPQYGCFFSCLSAITSPCRATLDPVAQGTWQPTASKSTCSSKCLSFSVPVPTSQRKDFTYPAGASPIELEGRTLCINVAPRNAPWWTAGREAVPVSFADIPKDRLLLPQSAWPRESVSTQTNPEAN